MKTKPDFHWTKWLERMVCIVVGMVFLLAGIAKLQQPYDFLSGLYDYQLFSANLGLVIAKVLPPLEIAIGLGLIFQFYLPAALLLSCLMSLGFTVVRAWVINNDMEVECNCFGSQTLLNTETTYIDWQSLLIVFIQFVVLMVVFFRVWARSRITSPSTVVPNA